MKHSMKLKDGPYNSIYNGTKDIEMRLYDEKRKLININDIITFTNVNTMENFDVRVINLHRCNSFEELYSMFNKVRLGYKIDEEALPSDMKEYYSDEEILKYGVIGIEIEKK